MIKYPEKKEAEITDSFLLTQEKTTFNDTVDLFRKLNPPIDPLKVRFKGKRVDNGEYIEGFLVIQGKEAFIYTDKHCPKGEYYMDEVEVHPDSVELIITKEQD